MCLYYKYNSIELIQTDSYLLNVFHVETLLSTCDFKIEIRMNKIDFKSVDNSFFLSRKIARFFLRAKRVQYDFKKSNIECRMVFFAQVLGKVEFSRLFPQRVKKKP